jgi:inner membrane protein
LEPVTQALLGAATGQLVAGRQIGRQALLFGALVGMSPDLDVVLGGLHDGFGGWLYHRGTTHSLWFGFVAGPAIGLFLRRWRDPEHRTPAAAWMALAVVALVTHPLLDGFTAYGTQLFAPFSRTRFAWNGVSIVDPIYTSILAGGVAWAAARKHSEERGHRGLIVALTVSSLYLGMGLWTNHWVVRDLERIVTEEDGPPTRIRAYPTILQPWLRHFVVHVENRRYVGFHSLANPNCPSWRVHTLPPSNLQIEKTLSSWEGGLLVWFSDGDYGIEERVMPFGTSVVIDDLRYAWSNAEARGMWGIEARFDTEGEFYGPIRRVSRASPRDRDYDRVWRAMAGQLPGPEEGFSRPAACSDSALAEASDSR